jgi:uncharacterized protein (UPF0305 family)
MNPLDLLNRYLENREKEMSIYTVFLCGQAMKNDAKYMGTKRMITEYQIDAFIANSKQIHRKVISFFESKADLEEKEIDILTQLSSIEMNKLYNCKEAGDLIRVLAKQYRQRKGVPLLFMPLFPRPGMSITLLEGFALVLLFVACMGAVRLFNGS